MMRKRLRLMVSLGLVVLTSPAFAELKGVAHLGYELGGENILETNLTYSSDGSAPSIKAGNGLVVAGGGAYYFTPELSVQTTVGWKYQSTRQAQNGTADFTRFPVDAMALYKVRKIRVGWGITHHLRPKLSGSGVLADYTQAFEDATGSVIQLDYVTDSGIMFGVRRTTITYTTKGTGYEADGSSFGVHIAGAF